jgi:probable rRNA maturation factor
LAALHVLVVDARGRAGAAPGLARWLARVAPAQARGTVSLAIVSDQRMCALNRQYLGRDYPTDVLSFPVEPEFLPPRTPRTPRNKPVRGSATSASSAVDGFLGDIVIARGMARRQARVAGHTEGTEFRVLALHGLLHLLGYDHHRDRGKMYRVEQRLRRKGGLREGLIERAQTTRPSTGSGRALAELRTGSGRAVAELRTGSGRVRARHARGEPVEPRARRR